MSPYTTNLCWNPGMELGVSGYTQLTNTSIAQTFVDSASGRASMQVVTAGVAAGEGFYGPAVVFPSDTTGSLSVALSGPTGTLQVSAAANPGGVVLASATIDLTNQWQTVQLNGLNIAGGTSLYILVQTPTAQVLTFRADCVQYEPESPGHPYIDGSLPGCYWEGAPNTSASIMPVQYPVNLVSGAEMSGTITTTGYGEVIDLALPSSEIVSGGSITTQITAPAGAFDDFALFLATDLDPAMTYAGWNNALKTSGQANYNRNWAVFYPPVDYPVSDGTNAWNRAAYMAMGHEFVNVPAGISQNMTLMQVEQLPLVGTNGLDYNGTASSPVPPGPSAYDTPRSIHLTVKPARLNLCTNPSFESSLAGWTTTTSTTVLVQDNTQVCIPPALPTDAWSMKVVSQSAADGALLTVPDLFVGDTYTASVFVRPGTGTADIVLTTGQYAGGVPGYAMDALIAGFGNVPPDLTPGEWVQAQVTFTATASTMVLTLTPMLSTTNPTAAFPLTWNADCCLIEEGENVGTYFDGNFGAPDYQWETSNVTAPTTTTTTTATNTWSFEGGISGWAGVGCSAAQSTYLAHSGNASMQLISDANNNTMLAFSQSVAVSPTTTVIPISAWFLASAFERECQVGVAFYTLAGALISTPLGSAVLDTAPGWTQVTASVLVPAGAAWASAVMQVNAASFDDTHYIDDVMMTINAATTTNVPSNSSYLQNLSRSYYYENYYVNQEVITDILTNHTPLGITPAIPLYDTPPSQ